MAAIHPTAARLQERLHAMGLEIAVQTAPATARTAAQAAAALGCEVGQIVKSLVFVRGDEPVVVLCAGDRRVAAQRLGLTPASADQARAAGGTPDTVFPVTPQSLAVTIPEVVVTDVSS